MFLMKKQLHVSLEEVFKFTVSIGIVQAFLGILQYIAPPALVPLITVAPYTSDEYGNIIKVLADTEVGSIAQGTLGRFNSFGNFLAYVFIFFLGFRILNSSPRKIKDWIILIILGFGVLISGNRASVLSVFASGLFLLFYYRRKLFFVIATFLVLFFIYANLFIDRLISLGSQSATNPFERLLTAFVVFKGSSRIEDTGSTLFLSLSLIPDFLSNFFLGAGKYYTVGYSLVGANLSVRIYDSFLMTLLAEFGIIGFLFILFPYIYIYNYLRGAMKRQPQYPIFIAFVILFLLQTVTDNGIFGSEAIYFFILFVMGSLFPRKRMIKYNVSFRGKSLIFRQRAST
jgi:hypothetical protein